MSKKPPPERPLFAGAFDPQPDDEDSYRGGDGGPHIVKEPKALARADGPSTSRLSAEETVAEGLEDRHRYALAIVASNPDRTAMELAVLAGDNVDSRKIGRRLSELRDAGYIFVPEERRCTVTKRKAQTWRLVP